MPDPIVNSYDLGDSIDEIHEGFPTLSVAQIKQLVDFATPSDSSTPCEGDDKFLDGNDRAEKQGSPRPLLLFRSVRLAFLGRALVAELRPCEVVEGYGIHPVQFLVGPIVQFVFLPHAGDSRAAQVDFPQIVIAESHLGAVLQVTDLPRIHPHALQANPVGREEIR